jgi:hypothetical protein
MAQAVSRRTLTSEARVRSQVSPCEVCGTRSVANTKVSLPLLPISPVSIIPPTLHAYLHLHVPLSRRKNLRNLRSFHQKYSFRNRERLQEK